MLLAVTPLNRSIRHYEFRANKMSFRIRTVRNHRFWPDIAGLFDRYVYRDHASRMVLDVGRQHV